MTFAAINFVPAQDALGAMLARFDDLAEVSDINVSASGVAVRRGGISTVSRRC
jgi:hypothetical protein